MLFHQLGWNSANAKLKACTYDQKPITLDGEIDVSIGFGKETLCTTVYIKLIAPDQLLLCVIGWV